MVTNVLRGVAKAATVVAGVPTALSICYSGYVYAKTPEDQISELHTPYSIWVQSLTNLAMSKLGEVSSARLAKSCEDAKNVNEQLLLNLIAQHQRSEYGNDFALQDVHSREDFQTKHPLTEHNHYNSYIKAVMDGKDNVMFPDRPRLIAETSGTSGTRKLLPVSPLQRQVFFTEGIGVTFDALQKGVTKRSEGRLSWPNLQKSCKLMYSPLYGKTNSGLKVGPNASTPNDNRTLLHLYTTPQDAWDIQDRDDMLFVHCLYALLDRNLGFIESNFASGVFNLFVCMNDRWEELVDTVRSGTLPTNMNIDERIRSKLESKLLPNPSRADDLHRIYQEWKRDKTDCMKSSNMSSNSSNNHNSSNNLNVGPTLHKNNMVHCHSLARRIWPTLHTILAVETGAFQIYGEKLRNEYWANDITIYSPIYAATEGLIGVNPSMEAKAYILHPRAMFYEFLPMDDDNNNNNNDGTHTNSRTRKTKNDSTTSDKRTTPLFLDQLQVGKEYELLITNLTGLYRYRFGDVVRCVGYCGKAPIVEFAYRKGQFLNALGERTSEEAFYKALSTCCSQDWKNLELGEYSAVEYFARQKGSRKPKYTVFVELVQKGSPHNTTLSRPMTKQELNAFDKRLSEFNDMYRLMRRARSLLCVEVIPVKEGTFQKLRKEMIERGVNPSQLKVPRVTRNERLVKILEAGAITK